MALIKPRTRGRQFLKHRLRFDRETTETLYAYAAFLGESTEYVLTQVIDTVLGKDRDFLQWRTTHQESYLPRPVARGRRLSARSGDAASALASGLPRGTGRTPDDRQP